MTKSETRSSVTELTEHLEHMADSLDDHVTHDDVHRLLMEAVALSRRRDAALLAALEVEDMPFPEFHNVHAINTRDGHNMALDKVRRAISRELDGGNCG
ncbi:hypothetical protein LG293_15810 (plasmid) [Citricoccus nitrophenolicus]